MPRAGEARSDDDDAEEESDGDSAGEYVSMSRGEEGLCGVCCADDGVGVGGAGD
jgi:hypothetical protein